MHQPQNHRRLNEISHFPRLEDLKLIMGEALKLRGSIIELPWRSAKTGKFYAITGLVEITSSDIVWTLFLGEGQASTAVWSTGFNDLEMLVDVMALSLPDETEHSYMPHEVAPRMARPGLGATPPQPGTTPPVPGAMPPNPAGYPQAPGYPPAQQYPQGPANPSPHSSGSYPMPPGYPPVPYPPGFQPPPGSYPLPPGYAMPPGYVPLPGYPPYPAAPGYPPPFPQVPNPVPNPAYPPQPSAYPPQPSGAAPTFLPTGPRPAPNPSVQAGSKTVPAPPAPRQPDAELLKKKSNVRLGQFFVQADLIPPRTLEAALFLQDIVKGNVLTTTQAAEALARAHNRGGTLESNIFLAKPKPMDGPRITLPLGQIMVEAGLISPDALEAALNLQDAARTGVLTADEALSAFVKDTFKKGSPTESQRESPNNTTQLEAILLKSGLITNQDIQVAQKVETKHGGSILNILFAAGKIDQSIVDAATELISLVEKKKLKEEQAVMALDYCQRSRVSLKEALEELHWQV